MKYLYKIKNFLYSLFWHTYRGFPKSSQELINYRYKICSECELFDQNSSQCLVCGCNINKKKIFMNKLAWSDQQCPQNKW
jgi:hypothetical protein